MSIRTCEELSDRLDELLGWRKKEITDIKGLVDAAASAGSRRTSLLRCGVAILYAHWEGFIKEAATSYLEFVSRKQLPYNELAPNFVAVGIKSLLNRASQSKRASDHNELVTFFLTKMKERSSLPHKAGIDTESNLSSKVLREIIEKLGFDYSFYVTKEHLINENLVKKRNTIAHGSYLLIDAASFGELVFECSVSAQLAHRVG